MKKIISFLAFVLIMSFYVIPVSADGTDALSDVKEPDRSVIVNYDADHSSTYTAFGVTYTPVTNVYGTITYTYQGGSITAYSLSSRLDGYSVSNVPDGYIAYVTQTSCVFSVNSSNVLQASVTYRVYLKKISTNVVQSSPRYATYTIAQ